MENLHVDLLYLDMNSYFASVEQQVDASLRGRPVGVVTTLHEGACCIAASYEAKALGIRTGTRMREARQMCPDITFRAARHDLYVDYHHRIKAAVETVLPIEGVHSVDEFSCRLTGPDRGLQSGHSHTADLFEARRGPGELTARERLCLVVDGLNQRYGSDTVMYGERPVNMTPYTGAKIAFGRVPERVEFQD